MECRRQSEPEQRVPSVLAVDPSVFSALVVLSSVAEQRFPSVFADDPPVFAPRADVSSVTEQRVPSVLADDPPVVWSGADVSSVTEQRVPSVFADDPSVDARAAAEQQRLSPLSPDDATVRGPPGDARGTASVHPGSSAAGRLASSDDKLQDGASPGCTSALHRHAAPVGSAAPPQL